MGMFNKDVLYGGVRLDESVEIGDLETGISGAEKVILLDAQVVSQTVPTDIGNATKTRLAICRLNDDGTPNGDPFEVGTLAQAIAAKVTEGEPGDLPAVVGFFIAPAGNEEFSNALVMQFIGRYDGPDVNVQPLVDPFSGEVSSLTAPGSAKPKTTRKPAETAA